MKFGENQTGRHIHNIKKREREIAEDFHHCYVFIVFVKLVNTKDIGWQSSIVSKFQISQSHFIFWNNSLIIECSKRQSPIFLIAAVLLKFAIFQGWSPFLVKTFPCSISYISVQNKSIEAPIVVPFIQKFLR